MVTDGQCQLGILIRWLLYTVSVAIAVCVFVLSAVFLEFSSQLWEGSHEKDLS